MCWVVIRTAGRDVLMSQALRRSGFEVFCPELHTYYFDQRQRQQRHRVSGLFAGYAFAQIRSESERAALREHRNCAGILGSWSDESFRPAEIQSAWINSLMESGPMIVGRKVPFRKGARVKVIIGRLVEQILEIDRVEGRQLVAVLDMLGGPREVRINPDHVRLVDAA